MRVNNLKLTIGNKTILDGVSFILNDEDKIGLVGVNGCGKSSLLKTLSSNLKPDSGEIKLEDQTIGYLKQEIPHGFDEHTILDYIKAETKIDKLETRLHELENNLTSENMDEYGEVLNQYLAIDGYSFEENLQAILNGLHLKKSLSDKIHELSGGEKIKVLLAVLLLQNNDILLLDEPTNNLDIEAIEWLETYLKKSQKKIIMVSHDETFLNNITNKIFELENGKIKEFHMSYNDYLREKQNEYNRKREDYTKAIEEQERIKRQVQKAKEWANKGNNKKAHNDNDKLANNYAKERTNTSNISKYAKALENLSIPDFEEKKPINIFFTFANDRGNRDIILSELICGYETFKTPEINLQIPFGTRLQILGGNGSGKTTLIKTIIGNIEPQSGEVIKGHDAKIGYISQDTLEENIEKTIVQYLTDGLENVDLSLIFILLDKFSIKYEDKDKPYSALSPGERTRVNLVKIALDKTNILILDEITNHLDKEAIDLIYELVAGYQGTIISISHNRKFNEILNPDMKLDIKTGLIWQDDFSKTKRL